MNHRFEFDAPPRARILGHAFLGIHVDWPEGAEPLWWDYEARRWITETERREREPNCSSHGRCRSFKAFKRHVRRHAEALRGREVTLVSRFEGCDIRVVWEDAA